MPPVLSYSIARVALFAAVLLGLLLALPQLSVLLVAAIAALVSGILSYFLLAGSREAMARSVARRVRRVQERLDRAAAAEDDTIDRAGDRASDRAGDRASDRGNDGDGSAGPTGDSADRT
jgi:hypothetical protein